MKKELEEMFCKSDIYIRFMNLSLFIERESLPTEEDWKKLNEQFGFFYPTFLVKLKNERLSVIRFRLCLLLCMGFRTKEIRHLLGLKSLQQVSNTKRAINKVVFADDCATSLTQHLKEML